MKLDLLWSWAADERCPLQVVGEYPGGCVHLVAAQPGHEYRFQHPCSVDVYRTSPIRLHPLLLILFPLFLATDPCQSCRSPSLQLLYLHSISIVRLRLPLAYLRGFADEGLIESMTTNQVTAFHPEDVTATATNLSFAAGRARTRGVHVQASLSSRTSFCFLFLTLCYHLLDGHIHYGR